MVPTPPLVMARMLVLPATPLVIFPDRVTVVPLLTLAVHVVMAPFVLVLPLEAAPVKLKSLLPATLVFPKRAVLLR